MRPCDLHADSCNSVQRLPIDRDLAAYLDRNAGPRDTEATQSFRPQMLIFDQFEEILTLDPTDLEAKHDPARYDVTLQQRQETTGASSNHG